MPRRKIAKKNSGTALKGAPYDVVGVNAGADFQLVVEFLDGTKGIVDLSELLFAPNPGVFGPLRDPAKFREAYAHPDGFVAWPDGQDLAPDTMHQAIKASGRHSPKPFRREPRR